MGPIWGRQDPDGPHVGPMNLVIWVILCAWDRRHTPIVASTYYSAKYYQRFIHGVFRLYHYGQYVPSIWDYVFARTCQERCELVPRIGWFSPGNSPCGCGELSVRLGSRISPHRNRVVVEVHWRGAQGWRSISWVVATFNHVGGSFNLSMAATGDVWIIPSFRIWGYVLHVEHISCVITNCGQLQWAIPSLFSIAL